MSERESSKSGFVRRRHVCYIAGYDPLGVAQYHRLFKRELKRAQAIWPLAANVSEPVLDADGLAGHWQVETAAPNWQTLTTYEFLRWDDLVARDQKMSLPVLFIRTLQVLAEYLLNGTLARIFSANWRFGLFFLAQSLSIIILVIAPPLIGWWIYRFGVYSLAMPIWFAAAIAGATVVATYVMLRRFFERWYFVRLAICWILFRDWAHGRRPDLSERIDRLARRIISRARTVDADELIIVGHSGGGTIGIPIVARALDIDPDFARAGAPVTLLALGTSLPLAAMHPRAADVRAAIKRLATEPTVIWIDCQSRKDVANFYNFDMVSGVGVDAGPQRCNPRLWNLRFRDIVSTELYNRLRWNFHRMHFQFIMANDRRADYDYFMFVCGPVRLTDWYNGRQATLGAFAADVTYTPAAATTAVSAA